MKFKHNRGMEAEIKPVPGLVYQFLNVIPSMGLPFQIVFCSVSIDCGTGTNLKQKWEKDRTILWDWELHEHVL